MWQAITSIVTAILGALFGALRIRRRDAEYDAAIRKEAVADAALETQEAIHEVVAERDDLPDAPSDVEPLADELRGERSVPGGREAARRRRPF